MDLLSTFYGSLMEGFCPRLGPGQDRRLGACPRRPLDGAALVARGLRAGRLCLGRRLRRHGPRDRPRGAAMPRQGRPLRLILPVGPMGMYRWAVYFLREWDVPCDHVHGFNMDEWTDGEGNTLPADNPGAFTRHGGGLLRAARRADRAAERNASSQSDAADLRRAIAELKKQGPAGAVSSASAGSATSPSGSRTSPPSSPTRRLEAQTHRSAPACTR